MRIDEEKNELENMQVYVLPRTGIGTYENKKKSNKKDKSFTRIAFRRSIYEWDHSPSPAASQEPAPSALHLSIAMHFLLSFELQ